MSGIRNRTDPKDMSLKGLIGEHRENMAVQLELQSWIDAMQDKLDDLKVRTFAVGAELDYRFKKEGE